MPLLPRRALAMAAALLVASPLAHAKSGNGQVGYKACKVGGICKPGVPVGFFPNTGLDGPLVPNGVNQYKINGWDLYAQRVKLNGQSIVAGFPTPMDPTLPPNCPCPNDDCALDGAWSFDVFTDNSDPPPTGSQNYMQFESSGDFVEGYGILHGPYIVSELATLMKKGAVVSFDWQPTNNGDAFDVFGYLLNVDTGATTIILDAWGNAQPWTTSTFTVPATGNYKLVFMGGTYDATGGTVAGSTLLITNIKVANNDLSPEECIDACLGYGKSQPWGPYGWANYNPGTDEVCTCSTDCAGGYDTSAGVSDDATVWALEPNRCPGDPLPTLAAMGPKTGAAREAKTTLTITLNGAKVPSQSVSVASHRELRKENEDRELMAGTGGASYGISYWAVRVEMPMRVRVLSAPTPSGVSLADTAIVNTTTVFWPRIPLKEGPNSAQRITLKLGLFVEPTVTETPLDFNPLEFKVTAKSGPYRIMANPSINVKA